MGQTGSTNALNRELNHVARNTNDTGRARRLVAAGADLRSTNGGPWHHTPLHQAAYHGRFAMAETLVALGAPLDLHCNAQLFGPEVLRIVRNPNRTRTLPRAPQDRPDARGGGQGKKGTGKRSKVAKLGLARQPHALARQNHALRGLL